MRKSEIDISMSWKILLLGTLLGACVSPDVTGAEGNWKMKNIVLNEYVIIPNRPPTSIINMLTEDYTRQPAFKNGGRLEFDHVLDDGAGRNIYVFSIEYIDDIKIGYVLNTEFQIVDRIKFSTWS